MAQDFRDLLVWQKAMELSVCVYKLTQAFPGHELYGLTSQMRRASVSIASNVAEGRGRLNPAEFRQFLGLAQGSAYELRTQLQVAKRIGLACEEAIDEADSLGIEVSRMLGSFIQTLAIEVKSKKRTAV